EIAPGARAGLIVLGESHAALSVAGEGGARRVSLLVDDRPVHSAPVAPGAVRLSVSVADGGVCRFSYADASNTRHDIDHLYQARPGRWVGAKVGLFAVTNSGSSDDAYADFDYFRFSPPQVTPNPPKRYQP